MTEEEIYVMKNKSFVFFLLIKIIALIIFYGCGGGPDLERTQPRHKITLEGRFLTETPDEIRFPMKVLFAIDCSLSMGDDEFGIRAGSDPDSWIRYRVASVQTG